jgi:hypothetical protein
MKVHNQAPLIAIPGNTLISLNQANGHIARNTPTAQCGISSGVSSLQPLHHKIVAINHKNTAPNAAGIPPTSSSLVCAARNGNHALTDRINKKSGQRWKPARRRRRKLPKAKSKLMFKSDHVISNKKKELTFNP